MDVTSSGHISSSLLQKGAGWGKTCKIKKATFKAQFSYSYCSVLNQNISALLGERPDTTFDIFAGDQNLTFLLWRYHLFWAPYIVTHLLKRPWNGLGFRFITFLKQEVRVTVCWHFWWIHTTANNIHHLTIAKPKNIGQSNLNSEGFLTSWWL